MPGQLGIYHRAGPILARVVFIGLDFSQRSGNYFAHTLVSQELVGFGEMLPIELWESPIWVSKPVSDTELRVLHELPPSAQSSGLSRVEVDRFARDAGRAEPLAALLTAAEDAILRDGRPIVIVHPDTAVAARWIGAVSYLLPRGGSPPPDLRYLPSQSGLRRRAHDRYGPRLRFRSHRDGVP